MYVFVCIKFGMARWEGGGWPIANKFARAAPQCLGRKFFNRGAWKRRGGAAEREAQHPRELPLLTERTREREGIYGSACHFKSLRPGRTPPSLFCFWYIHTYICMYMGSSWHSCSSSCLYAIAPQSSRINAFY